MSVYSSRVIFSVCLIWLSCSVAFADTRFQVTEIPDEVPAQLLTSDGHVLGLDSRSGKAVFWSSETGITPIPAPDGYQWSRLMVSPGGRFLGAAFTPDNTVEVYFEGQLGSSFTPVSWPASLPTVSAQGGASTAGAITVCNGPCPPDIPPPFPDVPLPPRFFPNTINDEGVIAGSVAVERSSVYVIRPFDQYAFRLHPNGQIDLIKGLQALSINGRGDALVKPIPALPAFCATAHDTMLWTADGQLLSPDLLPGYENFSLPLLNNLGEIAGTATNEGQNPPTGNPSSGNVQGFRWTPGYGTIALDLLPGFTSGIVNDLNIIGSAVGEATNINSVCGAIAILDPAAVSTVAVMWNRDGHVVDLNSAIKHKHKHHAPDFALLVSAGAINDAGQILALGRDRSGNTHNYLLSPEQERDSGADERYRHGDHDDSKNQKHEKGNR